MPFDSSKPFEVVGPSLTKKAVAVGMGAAESFNPLSILHDVEATARAVGKGIKSDLSAPMVESPEGLIVPGKPEKPLSFSSALEQARRETVMPDLSIRNLLLKTPAKNFVEGLPHNYEAAGGIAGAVLGMGLGAKGLLQGSKIKQAEKSTENVVKDIKYLTGQGEGQVMDAILNRASEVGDILKSGKLNPSELGLSVAGQLKKTQTDIGQTVGLFRDMAKADTKPSINVGPVLQRFNQVEQEALTAQGTSALSKTDFALMDKIRSLLPELNKKGGAKISPSDALLISDTIDQMSLAADAKPGNVHGLVLKALRDTRADIKNAARNSSGIGKTWALADEKYSQFKELSDGLINRFEGDQRVSAVNSLLNDAKDPVRERLKQALDIISEGKELKPSDAFFNQLSNLKAAQGLKEVEITKGDKTADQVNRIFNKWKQRGQDVGEATGTIVGGAVLPSLPIPHVGHGMAEAVGGAYIGSKIGKTVGGFAGEVLGRAKGSPEAILKAAERAKILSKEAKDLASDLGFFQKTFGIEGANIFWNSIQASVPAAHELTAFINAQLSRPATNVVK